MAITRGQIRVVLVRPHSPGNLGAAARAAKNFGAGLVLVDPRADRGHEDARAFASGAEDVLDAAEIAADASRLAETVDLVVALTSARGRVARGLPPRLRWSALRRRIRSGAAVALVFGPERGGLTTDELRRAGARLSIPTEPAFPTLNLSQAVSAALALIAPARPTGTSPSPPLEPPAPDREVALLLAAAWDALKIANYPGPGHSAAVLFELEALLRRAEPTEREVKLLRGALSALNKALR